VVRASGLGFKEMCSGSEAGSYLRLIDLVYQSTLGLRVMKKKRSSVFSPPPALALAGARVMSLFFFITLKPRVE